MNTQNYLKVAVEAPFLEPLIYSSEKLYPRGVSVKVPLRTRWVDGVVIGSVPFPPSGFEIKAVGEVHEERLPLSGPFLQWLEWLSVYYLYPLGLVISMTFPALKKKGRKGPQKPSVIPQLPLSQAPPYTQEQSLCINRILEDVGFSAHLLHGVTGSGKTEVYLKILGDTISRGQSGIVIVPEISLTPQLIGRFSSRFPENVAVIHSHLTSREKTNQWWSMVTGEKKILIGARSALFCPLDNLGVVVVDEEHEPSFKQDGRLLYHARDAAIKLCQLSCCPIVLGSATPSLETWKNAQEGKYRYHQMTRRVAERKMPNISVIDMKKQRSKKERRQGSTQLSRLPFWMSQTLFQKLSEVLERGEQSMLFLNRRGVAQITICSSCGYTYECPNCAISLTLHKQRDLVCHYCNYTQALVDDCTQCGSIDVIPLGLGTELIETDLKTLFPQASIARADRDEIQNRESLEELIENMELGQLDILVGTQMIAKGLDFPKLTFVGLVMADVGFNLPDFRGNERSFQLITQVSGRSGRHSKNPGEVIIQTYNPEHPSITRVNDYSSFVSYEMDCRQEMGYPPFKRLASIRIQGMKLNRVVNTCQLADQRCRELIRKYPNYSSIDVLGPAPAPITRLHNKFRYHFLLKSTHSHVLNQFCRQVLAKQKWFPHGVAVSVDIDPIKML